MVVWEASGDDVTTASLKRTIETHCEHIEATTKGPLREKIPFSQLDAVLIEDTQKVMILIPDTVVT